MQASQNRSTANGGDDEPFDFIIVGGGASGAVVASRLSEDPKFRVLLLEAGAEPPPESHIPAACASMQGNSDTDWRFVDSGSPGMALGLVDERMRLPRGRMLGGSTSMNFQIYVRGHPADFDRWEEEYGAKGWGWNDVLPYFKRSEGVVKDDEVPEDGLCHLEGEEHGTDGPWTVSFRNPTLPSTAAFVEGCGRLGYTVGDYNGSQARTSSGAKGVVGTNQFTIKNGKRSSTYTAFLEPIRESRPNLTIVTGATVDRVVMSDGRAVGVHYVTSSGKESVHYAAARKEVILSCGAYQSPHVLLRSGVGPRDELESLGIDCVVDSPHVGRHLKDHLTLIVPFACENATSMGTLLSSLGMTEDKSTFEEYTSTGRGLPSSSLCDASVFYNTGVHPERSNSRRTHDAQISFMVTGMVPDLMEGCMGVEDVRGNFHEAQFDVENGSAMMAPIMLQPVSEGVVRLSKDKPRDSLAPPIIEHRYLQEDVDLKMMVSICKEAVAIKDAMGELTKVGDVLVPKNVAGRRGTDLSKDELWEDWIRHYANTCYHPTSTCRMGDVVDAECRVVGVDGLRVADASVMPDIVSGNTQAACVMIGEKVADMIASDHGVNLSCC